MTDRVRDQLAWESERIEELGRDRAARAGRRVHQRLGSMIRHALGETCDVDVATGAVEGLALLVDGGNYDVVLCDLMMPDKTGMDLYTEVARRWPGVERRFVFMTGGALTPRASELLAGIKNRRLEKPFETSTLRAIVAEDD